MTRRLVLASMWLILTAIPAMANDEPIRPKITDWPPTTMPGALLTSIVFGAVGIAMAVAGFRLFDWLTPGDLQKEVFENKNVAAAILGAAVIIGLCHILAAAVH